MRRAIICTAYGLIMAYALICVAGSLDVEKISITSTATNAATTVYVTNSNVKGWIEEIVIDVVSAVTTGDLTIAVQPQLGTAETIYDKDKVAADLTIRPRLDGSDAAGSALTNDVPWRKTVVGDSIVLTYENCNATSRTVNVSIKYEKKD